MESKGLSRRPYLPPRAEELGSAEEATFGIVPGTPYDKGTFAARPASVSSSS